MAYTDDDKLDAAKFWPGLQQLLAQPEPNGDAIADLMDEYRRYGDLIDADEDENRRAMLQRASALRS
jgi:hypothetical protein